MIGVERPQLAGERLRGGRPDVADREPDQQPPQRAVPRLVEPVRICWIFFGPKPRSPSNDSAVSAKTSPMSLTRSLSSSAIAVS